MPKPHPRTLHTTATRDRQLHAAAFDLMCRPVHLGGQRPLKPPPVNFALRAVSAAALALRADRKAGLL